MNIALPEPLRAYVAWLVDGFPLTFWYFEREAHIDV